MRKKNILFNTAINTSGKAICFIINFVMIAIMVRVFGKDNYGLFVLGLGLVGARGMIEPGVGLSVTKYVAEYAAKGDKEKINEVVSAHVVMMSLLSILFGVIFFVINELYLDRIFAIPSALIDVARLLFRFFIVQGMIEFGVWGIVRIAEGFQQYKTVRIVEVFKWLLRLLGLILVLVLKLNVSWIGCVYLCVAAIQFLVLWRNVFLDKKLCNLDFKYFKKQVFESMLGFSAWIYISKMSAFLLYRVNVFIIGIFLEPSYLAIYDIAFRVYELLKMGFSLLVSTLVPVSSELNALEMTDTLKKLFVKSTQYILAVLVPILAFVWIYGAFIIEVWVGEGFLDALPLLRLLLIAMAASGFISAGCEMMVGIDRVHKLVIWSLGAALINLIVALTFIDNLGLRAVVIGTMLGTIFMSIGYFKRMLHDFKISFVEMFNKSFCKLTLYVFLMFVLHNVLYRNIAVGVGISILYLLFLFLFWIDGNDKKVLLSFLNKKA